MKKLLLFSTTLFSYLGYSQSSQTLIYNVIGRYYGECKVLNPNNTNASPPCNCAFEFWQSNFWEPSLDYQDSCYSNTVWDGGSHLIDILTDSTFKGLEPWEAADIASGKLYSNDSLFFRIHYPVPPTGNYWREFRGFKLYAFVGFDELSKPENELIFSPQPANDIIYIQSTQLVFRPEDFPIVYNISGKQLSLPVQYINTSTYKMDVSTLSAGMYVITIKTEKGFVRKKIIIEK